MQATQKDLFEIIEHLETLTDKKIYELAETACHQNWEPIPAPCLLRLLNTHKITPEQASLFIRNYLAAGLSKEALKAVFGKKEERNSFYMSTELEPDFQKAKDHKTQLKEEEEEEHRRRCEETLRETRHNAEECQRRCKETRKEIRYKLAVIHQFEPETITPMPTTFTLFKNDNDRDKNSMIEISKPGIGIP